MELNDLLAVMDRAAANLAKLEEVWNRAAPFIPTGPARGSHPEYDDLRRTWDDLLAGLPRVDGWTITEPLPDIDEVGQAFLDYAEISEPPFAVQEAANKPASDIGEYRFRLHRARRRAARKRLEELTADIDSALPRVVESVNTVESERSERIEGPDVDQVVAAVAEIERLMGDSAQRRGRWSDLHRHLHFGEGHDWDDIHTMDWPSVRADVEAAGFGDTDPLPVPDLDLGEAAGGHLTGSVTVALPWDRLDDEAFERLLYDLLREFPEHQNVQWLMNTRAPDRGRDLSLERVIHDSTGGVRTERVIVQAKHWRSRSVPPTEVASNVAQTKLWPPPVVRVLIIATSGRFSADAVAWAEQHNEKGEAPLVELWPDSRLETLLAQKPHIAAAHRLR
ncbi:restriction endonuclease [Blastococcus sp. SYSU DS0539]